MRRPWLASLLLLAGVFTLPACVNENRQANSPPTSREQPPDAPLREQNEAAPADVAGRTAADEPDPVTRASDAVISPDDLKAHQERVDDLFSEAKSGSDRALLWLGNADVDRAGVIERLHRECGSRSGINQEYLVAALAKLGDEQARTAIVAWFRSGRYQQEEAAISAFEYLSDAWAMAMLTTGLEMAGGPRRLFVEEVIGGERATAPPLRYACAAALAEKFPEARVRADVELVQERDVAAMLLFMQRAIPIQ